jgi:hypothetical protein
MCIVLEPELNPGPGKEVAREGLECSQLLMDTAKPKGRGHEHFGVAD